MKFKVSDDSLYLTHNIVPLSKKKKLQYKSHINP